MNSNMFSQTDSRWRKKKYPSGGYNVGNSGCGLCAVTHVLIEQNRYKNATPVTFWSYMKQYATKGHGTKWAGIKNGLLHFGHKSCKELECKSNKGNVYKEFNKGNRMAVALFEKGSGPDGTVWTNGGHYIAFIDYKVQNGKHYFYVKDSGGRHRKGWYCCENSMGKRFKRVWIVERLNPSPSPSPDPSPYKPTKLVVDGDWGKKTTQLTQYVLNKVINAGLVIDGDCGKKTIKAMQKLVGAKEDGDWGKATTKAMQRFLNAQLKMSLVVDGDCGKKTVKAWQTWLNTKI